MLQGITSLRFSISCLSLIGNNKLTNVCDIEAYMTMFLLSILFLQNIVLDLLIEIQ